MANIIFIEILYEYRNLFEVYPFDNKEFKIAKKTPQRFEICNSMIDALLKLPAEAVFSRRYFPPSFKQSAESLMKSSFKFFNEKHRVLNKSLEFIAGYPSDLIEDSFLTKVYENLDLTGNETLFESFQELQKFKRFILLIDINRDELDVIKIVEKFGEDVFSCTVYKLKFVCKKFLG